MEEFVNNQYLRFEYMDASGYKTIVEKEFETTESEFVDLLEQVRYSLLACGFSEDLIDEFIDLR